ncbi:MAG: YhdP family protein [Gallionella sp.]|nr:YhdP family protein [Gallionella sp.]
MSKLTLLTRLWSCFTWLARVASRVVMGAALLLATAILVLRYLLLPNIEHYHQRITNKVSQAIGAPVTIGQIEADWHGVDPRMTLRKVQVFDAQHRAALVLPEINIHLSWLSLPTLQIRLDLLEINHAELQVMRDLDGQIFIGGIALAQKGNNNDMSDWLLHQSNIVVRDARIVWQDDKRGAPPLVLNAVNLRLSSKFDRHRFALLASPDPQLSTPLDVRGDFVGHSFDQLNRWRGQIFTQLTYADITAWRPWFNLPQEFSEGQGGLRGWMQIAEGKITHLIGDLAVQNVITKLANDVPAMVLHRLNGRAMWQDIGGGFEIKTQKLTMSLKNGTTLPTTDLVVRIVDAKADAPAQGEIRANLLQLETLVSLANFVPIPKHWRAQLDSFAPHGKVSNLDAQWSGGANNIQHFKIKGDFDKFGVHQVGVLPGFDNLTADVEGDDKGGKVRVQSRQFWLNAVGILREPVIVDRLDSLLTWTHLDKEWTLNVSQLAAANADLAGTAQIQYHTARNSPGVLDLTVRLDRANVRQAARYTPLFAVTRAVSDWLHEAILSGTSQDFYLRIKGNLKDFPFEDNGIFELSAGVKEGAIRFSPDWPPIEKVAGNLLLQGKQLAFNTLDADMYGIPLSNVSVQLPDLMAKNTVLLIKGEATADAQAFLRLAHISPVLGYSQGFTDRVVANGDGHLDISVRIPQVGGNFAEVKGRYSFDNHEIDLGGNVPKLHHAKGELQFTQNGIQLHEATAEILGDPAVIDVYTKEGAVYADVRGNSRVEALRALYPHPVWAYLDGQFPWEVNVAVKHKVPHMVFHTDLVGLHSTLPSPFGKAVTEAQMLHVDKRTESRVSMPDQEIVSAKLGNLLTAHLQGQQDNAAPMNWRGTVNFGAQGESNDQAGIVVTGDMPTLSLQGWEGLAAGSSKGKLPLTVKNLHVGALTGYGQALHNVKVNAHQTDAGLLVQLASPALTGDIVWQSEGEVPKLKANLQNLNWQGDAASVPPSPETPVAETQTAAVTIQPGKLPALDVSIAHLQIKNKQIGKVQLEGQPEGNDWRLSQLQVTNPDGTVTADGVWYGVNPRTELNAVLAISDAGKVLGRSGYPKTVEKGSGKLAAKLAWAGTPMAFNFATLNGSLKLDTGNGRFLKIEPGIAKLLGVLSLQALPRHISLDFTDIFSDGFQFDNINGNALIKDGVMSTQDLHLDGSAAKVTMWGNVDLNHETQQLRVEVLPAIGESVSLLSGFAGGPVVGVGALIFTKVLGNPFDKLVSFQYNISGTWSEPIVVKVGQTPVKVVKPPPNVAPVVPENNSSK